ALAAAACSSGSIEDAGKLGPNGSGGSGGAFSSPPPEPAGADPRLVRLSHLQYQSTLEDLFGVTEGVQSNFAPDSLNGFKFDTSNDLRVDARLGPEYRTSAELWAERAVTESTIYSRLVSCTPSDAGCAAEFIAEFGQRAFRRPLTSEETGRFQTLFEQGSTLGDSGDAFQDGVQLVVEAMLQAPQFLYRAELSRGQQQNGRAALDDWEVASRLSYFIYDSMPDDTLFERARQGQLKSEEQIVAQVARMLDDPRATRKFVSFHEQLWQFGRYAKIAPDNATYPNLPTNFVDRLLSSSDAFLSSVIEDGGGLEEFLTAPYAFADAELAPFYGSSVSGSGTSRVTFANGERKGLLMQLGFLASNSYAIKTDPIHRGLFILRDVLCRAIPDPPPGAATTPPPETDEPIVTTRDEVSLLTGQSYCPTCHSQINEPGFAFEGFDAVGKTRQRDSGQLVDTTGSITLDGQAVAFQNAGELVEALAVSDEARECYVARWLEFTYGRSLVTTDQTLQDELAEQALGVKELVTTLATSPEFRSRAEVSQ
ncbi:MAG TPA: DUF1592 domain-containing protein, partial [Polyangiaceae bacterium]|nr:DUF1592 domain-containing protein [Polyangiaceae bacterium]